MLVIARSICRVFLLLVGLVALASNTARAQPLAWYNLDGDALDASGNGNHGTVTGTIAFDAGATGQALDVDPTAVNFLDVPVNLNPGFIPRATFGAWVQADSVSAFATILAGNNDDDNDIDPGIYLDTVSNPLVPAYAANLGNQALPHVLPGGEATASSDFVFVAAVYDHVQQTVRLHTDADVTTGSTFFTSVSQDFVRLGSNPGLDFPEAFDGSIDNVFFFNDALSVDEINAIRTGGFAAAQNVGVKPGELWSLDFQSDAATAVTDPGMTPGDVWNGIAPRDIFGGSPNTTGNLIAENLLDSTGAASTVDFRITGDAGTGDNNGQGDVSGFVQSTGFVQFVTFYGDWMLWNVPGEGVSDTTIEWELTGLVPNAEYDFSASGPLANFQNRGFDMLLDTDGDGDLTDETTQAVDASPSPGVFYPSVFADASGRIIGQSIARGSNEANWTASQLRLVSLPTLTGDYNDDGVVDAVDYAVWRENLGTNFDLPNRDSGSTGNVSQADYNAWRSNYGASLSGGQSAVTSTPEPAAALLVSLALGATMAQRTQRKRKQ